MNVLSLVRFISSRPLNRNHKLKAITRFVKWQLTSRLNPYPVIYPFTERCKLLLTKSLTGATGNLYCGLHEFNDMGFLLHFLRPEDSFIDIGANVGSYTVLASGHIGATTTCMEPVPSTFFYLLQNISINQMPQRVEALNIALGSGKGSINFTRSFDTMNHVACKDETDTIQVPVEILDEVLENKTVPALLKIDVEGFETEVIKGAAHTLQQPGLKAIIIELNGAGSRYGYNEANIHHTLVAYGFTAFHYLPFERTLVPMETYGSYNTIYVKDVDFVNSRVKTAPKVKILGCIF